MFTSRLRHVPPLALLAWCFVPAARTQTTSPSSLGVTAANGAVPIRVENGLLYLGGSLRGSSQLSFVADTGSAWKISRSMQQTWVA
jgi:hypothetical protein